MNREDAGAVVAVDRREQHPSRRGTVDPADPHRRGRLVDGADPVITIGNDGPDGGATGGHGVGLANVASRLALRYDGNAGCDHRRRSGGGFETRIILSLQFERHPGAIAA